MSRGRLRIYLGASPGVGKTYAMLNEGRRRAERGTDVVVGLVETHGRKNTASQVGELEVVPRKVVAYRGTTLEEMDVDAIIARAPQLVLVDEYAHTNAAGSRNEKRWQDVERLLDAGIDVISTLNIQHLESLNDVVTRITGVPQRETVPDAMVRRAEQIELVDMAPEAIRRRMAHGNIYPADRIDAALGNYFRPGNLGALRELALLWVADRVEENLSDYLHAHGISESWETRERVIVVLSGAPGGERLIRRAARMAGRTRGELIAVHVSVDDARAPQNEDEAHEAAAPGGGTRRPMLRNHRQRRCGRACRVRASREGDAGGPRRHPAAALARSDTRLLRRPGHQGARRHRPAHHRFGRPARRTVEAEPARQAGAAASHPRLAADADRPPAAHHGTDPSSGPCQPVNAPAC
ncbi:MAG: hypothetical protein V9E89_09465 [Ilumatobacteraceae bacterium]